MWRADSWRSQGPGCRYSVDKDYLEKSIKTLKQMEMVFEHLQPLFKLAESA